MLYDNVRIWMITRSATSDLRLPQGVLGKAFETLNSAVCTQRKIIAGNAAGNWICECWAANAKTASKIYARTELTLAHIPNTHTHILSHTPASPLKATCGSRNTFQMRKAFAPIAKAAAAVGAATESGACNVAGRRRLVSCPAGSGGSILSHIN